MFSTHKTDRHDITEILRPTELRFRSYISRYHCRNNTLEDKNTHHSCLREMTLWFESELAFFINIESLAHYKCKMIIALTICRYVIHVYDAKYNLSVRMRVHRWAIKDIKGVVRRHNSKKGRQCNGQNKDKIKQWSTNTTQKTKEWTPWTPLKVGYTKVLTNSVRVKLSKQNNLIMA
jgi:hypothetical protein